MTEFFIKNILADELFGNRICESLNDQKIVDYLYNELLLEKLLFGEPVSVPELRKLLRDKIVNFEFIKLNGEVRPAKGTLKMNYVPQEQHPKGIRSSSPKVATFYDLKKQDWRSVSQRSKEIVLKKDEETGKPIIMVKDKTDGVDVAVKDKQPEVTIDGRPVEEPIEKPEVSKVKPIEKTEKEKRYYFINPVTGASMIMDAPPKDIIKKLKELGKDWRLFTEKEYEEHEEEIEKSDKIKSQIKMELKAPEEETISEPKNIINKKGDELENIEADEFE